VEGPRTYQELGGVGDGAVGEGVVKFPQLLFLSRQAELSVPLGETWILFAHSTCSATMHGTVTNDRMTRRNKVGIGSSPLDSMLARVKTATTSLSGVGVLATDSAAVAEKSGNTSILLALMTDIYDRTFLCR